MPQPENSSAHEEKKKSTKKARKSLFSLLGYGLWLGVVVIASGAARSVLRRTKSQHPTAQPEDSHPRKTSTAGTAKSPAEFTDSGSSPTKKTDATPSPSGSSQSQGSKDSKDPKKTDDVEAQSTSAKTQDKKSEPKAKNVAAAAVAAVEAKPEAAKPAGSAEEKPADESKLKAEEAKPEAESAADPQQTAPEKEPAQPASPVSAAPDAPGASTTSSGAESQPRPATPIKAQPATIPAPASAAGTATGIRHVPGIDGLRGLAVASVVIYHLFGPALPGGYLGVDIFFVLSGFLITSLMLREYSTSGTINLKMFWVRRARRILPAALSVLVICSAIAGFYGGDVNLNLGRQFLSSALFVNNWVQIANSQSYFANAELPIFAHYWSLSVEEQFYIIWPLIAFVCLIIIGRRRSTSAQRENQAPGARLLGGLAALLAVASAIAMAIIFTPGRDSTRVYYGTDTHSFGLLIGAVLATLCVSAAPHKKGDTWSYQFGLLKHARVLVIAGIAALAVQIVYFFVLGDQETFTYRGGLFTSSIVAACLIASVVRNVGPVAAVFRNRILRHLGLISFSLYLWHVPANLFVTTSLHHQSWAKPTWVTGLIAALIALIASELSYRYIETPFRTLGYKGVWAALRRGLFGESTGSRKFGVALAPACALLACVLAGTAIANTSHESQVESDLKAIASQGGASQPHAVPAPKPRADRAMPKGPEMTAIGDSVMLASREALEQRFPGIFVDADISRHYTTAFGIIDNLKAQHALGQFVILGYGTNGKAFPGQMDELIKDIGPDRTIVIVMPYGDRDYMPGAQQQVIDAARKYPNVYASDWCEYAGAHTDQLYGDGIHPQPDGRIGYVNAIVTALKQWSKGKKEIPQVCAPAVPAG